MEAHVYSIEHLILAEMDAIDNAKDLLRERQEKIEQLEDIDTDAKGQVSQWTQRGTKDTSVSSICSKLPGFARPSCYHGQ
jgi:hypothetical protein